MLWTRCGRTACAQEQRVSFKDGRNFPRFGAQGWEIGAFPLRGLGSEVSRPSLPQVRTVDFGLLGSSSWEAELLTLESFV